MKEFVARYRVAGRVGKELPCGGSNRLLGIHNVVGVPAPGSFDA